MNNEQNLQELTELLIKRSYKKASFTLASGKQSDFFIDCKQSVLTAKGHILVGELMYRSIKAVFPDTFAVAGVELG